MEGSAISSQFNFRTTTGGQCTLQMDLSLAGPAHRAIASVKMSSCAGPDGALASRPRREAACCSHSGFLTGQCNNALVVRRRTTGLRSHGNWRCRGLWNFLSKNLNLGGNSKFGSDTGGVIKCEKKEEELQDEVPGLSLDNGSALPSLPPVKVFFCELTGLLNCW